jgi:hypothetical protein
MKTISHTRLEPGEDGAIPEINRRLPVNLMDSQGCHAILRYVMLHEIADVVLIVAKIRCGGDDVI